MTADRQVEIVAAYEAAFGTPATFAVMAPNYLERDEFYTALETATGRGTPVTVESLTPLLGEPHWEELRG